MQEVSACEIDDCKTKGDELLGLLKQMARQKGGGGGGVGHLSLLFSLFFCVFITYLNTVSFERGYGVATRYQDLC